MAGAIFARQVGAAPGQLGILGAQAHDHVGRQRLGNRPGIAATAGDARNLIVFGVSLRRLHPGFDELVVEVADLLVVDRHPLRRDEVVAGAEILDRLVGGQNTRLERLDLLIEPVGRRLGRIVLGTDLLQKIRFRDRVRDGGGLCRFARVRIDIDEEGGALARHLQPFLKAFYRLRFGHVFGARARCRIGRGEQALDRVDYSRRGCELRIIGELQPLDHQLEQRD